MSRLSHNYGSDVGISPNAAYPQQGRHKIQLCCVMESFLNPFVYYSSFDNVRTFTNPKFGTD